MGKTRAYGWALTRSLQRTHVGALAHRIRLFHPESGAHTLVAVILHFHILTSGLLGGVPIPHQRYFADIDVPLSVG